eukprot:TRINITY_DN13855_c0_g1_i3.p1 TRINITY_DN13855_c0_g1~~TRINITY_DN13855_c0_g1_i3.p1  ORF type:complete len:149 (-),score=9.49 TRINITY_DN13855_c0_g1_i3:413-859(-)
MQVVSDMSMPMQPTPLARQGFWCETCQRAFTDKQGLHLHATRAHGRKAIYHKYSQTNRCRWCLKEFKSRQDLAKHLHNGWKRRYNASCIGQLLLNDLDTCTYEDTHQARGCPSASGPRRPLTRGPLRREDVYTCDAARISTDPHPDLQ